RAQPATQSWFCHGWRVENGQRDVNVKRRRVNPVAQTFQSAGSWNFPVPWAECGNWKVPTTRRLESLRYGALRRVKVCQSDRSLATKVPVMKMIVAVLALAGVVLASGCLEQTGSGPRSYKGPLFRYC